MRCGDITIPIGQVALEKLRLFLEQTVGRHQLRILLLELQETADRLFVVGRIEDDELGAQRDRGDDDRQDEHSGGGGQDANAVSHGDPPKAGKARSAARYTFTRWPSRMVIVGRMLRNRSRMWSEDWPRLAPTPSR